MTALRPYQAAVARALTDTPTHPFMIQRLPEDAGIFPALGQLPVVLYELERLKLAEFVHGPAHHGCGWVTKLIPVEFMTADTAWHAYRQRTAPGFDPTVPSGYVV